MKDCATYSSAGAVIDNCQKVNFIYGPNGSGKSTISNFLRNQDDPQYSSCTVQWENNSKLEIEVYNRDFRTRHFQEDIDGVFTLGEATIDEINALEDLKKTRELRSRDLSDRKAALSNKKLEEQACKANFRDTVWNVILRQNETDFQEVFRGFRGNKEKFMNEVLRRYKISHSSSETKDDLLKRAKTLLAKRPEKCDCLLLPAEELLSTIDMIEKDQIWGKVIVGNNDVPIAGLIKLLENADWVNKGRSYIREDNICPFCQQKTITVDFRKQIECFFSGEYDSKVKYIKYLKSTYETTFKQLLDYFDSIVSNVLAVSVGNIDLSVFNSMKDILQSKFINNLTSMSSKEKEPGIKVTIIQSSDKTVEILGIISTANSEIEKHNQMVSDIDTAKIALIDSVWTFLLDEQEVLINSYLKDMSNFEKAKQGMQKRIDLCNQELSDLDNKIYEAGKNVTSVQPTVDEINRSLKAYGFTNFRIVPSPSKENCYQIQRLNGSLATTTLSEGEETFITFLYFLQLAKGSVEESKVSTKKVLVLDDPICSLDSTVLYIVSSMVKSLIKQIRSGESDVKQIFILTHNVFFHKEASFIDGRVEEVNDINYWIISKNNNASSIRAFGKSNPIKTSYELLWQEVKNNTNASPVAIQNSMRRIIENYFGMLGKNIDDEIVNSFQTSEDKMICRSLISWINDGSHSIPDDLYIDSYSDSIDRYKHIFKQIFINMGHEAHYNMMMK